MKLNKIINSRKKGFTLIELVIVVSIIAILILIGLPKFGKIQENAKQKADVVTAKNIAMAVNSELSNGKNKTDITEKDIRDYFSGDIKQQGTINGNHPGEFSVYLIKDEEISIFTGSRQVYPELKENATSSGTLLFKINCK